jgi:hypothetical protein
MMNGSVENVGINITSSTEQAIASLRKLQTVLVNSNKQFEQMNKQLDKIRGKGVGSAGGSFSDEMKDIADKTPRATKAVGSLLSVLARFVSLRMVMRFLGRAFNEMSEFAENYNLFIVSLGEAKDEALQFQSAMNKALGTNMSQTMRYQGFFQNLTTALGATNEQGFLLSKTLTMLTYDMASLFNWSPDVAFQRLQSGIVGQTKPLRYAGVDVTQQTIQPILGELGIDKQVIELTQYEKVLLRMIAILRQTGNAQGDFARTIESPANQIRILNDQMKELYRWIGGTFIGLISQALPFINGLVMALVEVFKMLSYLVGFTEDDFDFMNGSGGDDPFEGIEDGANGANEAVKKLTGNLRKFDEINNISMRSGASGVGGGISESTAKLWEELNKQAGYFDDTFKNVQSKAKDIKLKIMDWLSTFFKLNKEGDAFTGEITFWGVLLLGFIGLLAGSAIIGAFSGLATMIGGISTLLGAGGGVGLLASIGGVHGALLLLGGTAVIGGIKLLKDKLADVEEKVKKGQPLTTLEDVMWGIKLKTDEAKKSFKELSEEFFGKADGNPYAKSKFEVFLNNLNFHLQHTLGWIREMQIGFREWAQEVDKNNVKKFEDTAVGKLLIGFLNMLKDIIKYLDTIGVGVLEWLGFDMSGYKGAKATPPPNPTPPPPNQPPPTIEPPKYENKIVIDHVTLGKVIGTGSNTTPALQW